MHFKTRSVQICLLQRRMSQAKVGHDFCHTGNEAALPPNLISRVNSYQLLQEKPFSSNVTMFNVFVIVGALSWNRSALVFTSKRSK